MRQAKFLFFFFNDTATTEIYTLSLHDALPICLCDELGEQRADVLLPLRVLDPDLIEEADVLVPFGELPLRSEEHTSELQSRQYLVCRLLLEKKKRHRYRRCSKTSRVE